MTMTKPIKQTLVDAIMPLGFSYFDACEIIQPYLKEFTASDYHYAEFDIGNLTYKIAKKTATRQTKQNTVVYSFM